MFLQKDIKDIDIFLLLLCFVYPGITVWHYPYNKKQQQHLLFKILLTNNKK